jgi:hypothetical protein
MRNTSRGSAGLADANNSSVTGTVSFRYATRGASSSNVTTPMSWSWFISGWALGHITVNGAGMIS